MAINSITVLSDHCLNQRSQISTQREIQLHAILRNWNLTTSLASRSAILPESISPDGLASSEPLLPAIHELSRLTVGQRERAHSLLNTYFRERIRQGSYSGRNENIYATLEVQDVERAIQSAQRMKAGLALQRGSNNETVTEVVETNTINAKKRKYEGLEEIIRFNESCRIEETRPTKIQEPDKRDEIEEISPKTLPPSAFLPSPPCSHSSRPPAFSDSQPMPKRTHIRLPPITTTQTLAETSPMSTHESSVQGAQRATHEFNVCRIELSWAEREYIDARQRFEVAVEKMKSANAAIWER